MKDLSKKHKHLTIEERREIQECLEHGMSFKAIAARIGKDPTTVSKEVKKHITVKPAQSVVTTDLAGNLISPAPCPLLLKAPFVCNGCRKRRCHCPYEKRLYIAKDAHFAYTTLLVEAREGIPLNKDAFYEMDAVISAGIKKGQHLYHIMQTHALQASTATIYRHLHRGYLSVSKLDMPRVVKFKPRRQKRPDYVPKTAKLNRTYEDFLTYTQEADIHSWVEMDTVMGRIGGKVILTLHFTFCNFMTGLLLDDKTAAEASTKIRLLKRKIAMSDLCFGDIFPVLLTDNGGEFSNVAAFTTNAEGVIESKLFFCDPFSPYQKAKIEKNHSLFRDIVPKGTSFDAFSQSTVDLIFSHINSTKRKCLNGKTPYEMFTFAFGELVASLLGMSPIRADDVIQSPLLLKK